MSGPITESRRTADRFKIRSTQIAYLNFESGNSGIVLDVSTNGVGFQAVKALETVETNELISLRLSVPGFLYINLSGRVAWLDDVRKRGGLRLIVPVAEQQAFQRWLQQQDESSWIEAHQPDSIPCGPEFASRRQLEEAEEDAAQTRNLLVGCFILALSIVLAAGARFLVTTSGMGDLVLAHLDLSNANPQASATAADSRAPHSLTASDERPDHYDVPPFAPADELQSHPDPAAAAPGVSAPSVNSRSAPGAAAKISSASAHRAMSEERENPTLLPPPSKTPRVQPDLQTRTQALAPALNTSSSDVLSTVATNHNIVARPMETTNNSRPAVDPTTAPDLPASTAQSPAALNSQTPEPTANIEPCRLVSSVQAAYPKEARKQSVEGDVRLRVVVGTDGTVKSVAPLGGPPLLIEAAVDATRKFQYKPALLNGQPIETIQTIDISFKLKH